MKILVYGFGQYKERKDNFSAKVIKKIKRKNLILKKEVRFVESKIDESIQKHGKEKAFIQ